MQLEKPTRVRWLIFVLACAASWLLYLHRYAWGIIRPYFKDENPLLDKVDLGWLDGAFLATYAVGQIPGGFAGDRFGSRITLTVFTLAWSAAVGGVAWTSGFLNLLGARGTLGIAQAGVYPVLNKLTRTWFPLASRTSVQGIVTAMGRVGGACAPLIILYLLMGKFAFSWQSALVIISVPGIVLAILFWALLRNSPDEHPWTNAAENALLDSPRQGDTPAQAPATAILLTPASLLSFAMMLLYIFASTFQDQFYVNLLPTFLRDEKHLDEEKQGLFLPLVLFGGAAGGIIGGFLNDYLIRRTGNRRWSRSLIAFTGKSVAAALVILSMQFDDGATVMLVLVGVRIFSDWSLPTQWAAVTDMGGRRAATVFGIVNTVGAVGGFAAGPMFGYLNQHYDWAGVFYGVAAMCIFAALTWLFIDCTKRVVAD